MECVKDHVNSKWSVSKYKNSEVNTFRGYCVLSEMGLTSPFILDELDMFYKEHRLNAGILQRFFNENPDKSSENLELLDMVCELLHQRMLKLMDLNQAVEENLE